MLCLFPLRCDIAKRKQRCQRRAHFSVPFFFKLCGIILSVHDVGSQARKQNEKLSQMVIKTLLDNASKFIFGYRIPKEDKILRFKL